MELDECSDELEQRFIYPDRWSALWAHEFPGGAS